nr:unnamed protein product [Callosobruchus analis]
MVWCLQEDQSSI